jgi:hypothetical protein
MASTVDLWTPPAGMRPQVVKAWRAFYSRAIDTYGVEPADYRTMYVAQKGRCWICREARGIHPDDPKGGGSRRLAIDHDHDSGTVRGLLCSGGDKTCNRIIGWLNADQLERAAAYLKTRRGQPARVLAEARRQISNAERNGAQLTQDEVDGLVVAHLWPTP